MKIPSFKSILLAMVARFGNQSPTTPFVNKPPVPKPVPSFFRKSRPPVEYAPAGIANRFHSNQRQNHKDRRRAHAAGSRNAFA